jgi:hypothetical protein
MVDRGSQLSQYDWPALDAAFLAGTLRWLMAIVILGGLWWFVFRVWQPLGGRNRGGAFQQRGG